MDIVDIVCLSARSIFLYRLFYPDTSLYTQNPIKIVSGLNNSSRVYLLTLTNIYSVSGPLSIIKRG